MVKIEPLNFKGRLCNVCNSEHDVKLIVFGFVSTNSHVRIALCRECREVLLEELKNS